MQKEKIIIIGSGPAGLTAALYTARANLEPLVFSGNLLGGQISLTSEVENYPGFPDGTTGPELVTFMQTQAERFGARIEFDEVTGVDFRNGSPFTVETHSGVYQADAVIVTTGASARKLDVPGEAELVGKGVSYCATCDGFFFRDKDVVVVGGGDSALEEGIFLTRFASSVKIIHRRDELRAGEHLKEKALLSLMVQYIDTEKDREQGESRNTSSRKRESTTYRRILELLDSCTIENGYIQEETAVGETEWLPDFSRINPFPREYADPVWHWETGFL